MDQIVRLKLISIVFALGLNWVSPLWAVEDENGPYLYGSSGAQVRPLREPPEDLSESPSIVQPTVDQAQQFEAPEVDYGSISKLGATFTQSDVLDGAAICAFSVAKSTLTTLVEFPAENLTVRMQGDQKKTDFFRMCKQIWKQEGVSGFYRGWVPGYLRTLAKTGYQWSWIGALQNSAPAQQLEELDPSKNLKNAFIGVGVACLDTALLAPLEKMKVQTILSAECAATASGGALALAGGGEGQMGPQGDRLKSWVRSQPYRGATPFFAEQLLGWMLFLMGQNEGQNQAKKYFGEQNAGLYKPVLGLLLGGAETGLVLPFSNIRTKMILDQEPLQGQKWNAQTLVDSVRQMGVRGLYCGWKPALLRSVVAGVCDIYFISYLESGLSKKSREELK
jgi:hypothetical protein